jgi:hypothetical protein
MEVPVDKKILSEERFGNRQQRKGMLKNLSFFFGCLQLFLLATLFAGLGNPWDSKPYAKWNKKEVRAILEESPWVKVLKLESYRHSSTTESENPQTPYQATSKERTWMEAAKSDRQILEAVKERQSKLIRTKKAETQLESQKESDPVILERQKIRVLWLSSRTLREAVVRHWQLENHISDTATKRLLEKGTDFVIGVYREGLTYYASAPGWGRVDSASQMAYLRTPDTTLFPVAAERVHQDSVLAPFAHVVYYFSREPLKNALNDVVEFHCNNPDVVTVKFKVSAMQRGGSPDL